MKKKLLLALGICIPLGIQQPAKAHINLTPYTMLYTYSVATYIATSMVIAGLHTATSSFCDFFSNTDKPTNLYKISSKISCIAGLTTFASGLLLLSLCSAIPFN